MSGRSASLAFVAGPERPNGAERLARCLDADAVDRGAVGLAADHGRCHVYTDPARRLVAGRTLQYDLPGRNGERLTWSRVGDRLLLGRCRSQSEPDAVHRRGGRQSLQHHRRRLLHGPRFGQSPTDAEERLRFESLLGHLGRVFSLDGHEPADRDGHGQQEQ